MTRIEVFGTGCPKCQATVRNAQQAAAELGVEAEIVKVDDLRAIASRGVLLTPAVAIDGKVVISGRVATVPEIKTRLQEIARGVGRG